MTISDAFGIPFRIGTSFSCGGFSVNIRVGGDASNLIFLTFVSPVARAVSILSTAGASAPTSTLRFFSTSNLTTGLFFSLSFIQLHRVFSLNACETFTAASLSSTSTHPPSSSLFRNLTGESGCSAAESARIFLTTRRATRGLSVFFASTYSWRNWLMTERYFLLPWWRLVRPPLPKRMSWRMLMKTVTERGDEATNFKEHNYFLHSAQSISEMVQHHPPTTSLPSPRA